MGQTHRGKKKSKTIYALVFIAGFVLAFFSTNLVLGRNQSEVHISVVYSSEKASWMTVCYGLFMSQWQKEHPDQKISIDMIPIGSADSVVSILNGEMYPTIWSPASSIWIPFLDAKWAEIHPNEAPVANASEAVRIIYSPIVMATWQAFNESHPITSFADLYKLCANSSVDIKLAHTDPTLSNSGFMSTIMAISAVSGVPAQNLTMSDLTNKTNQAWFRTIESRAVFYGTSTGFLAKYMQSGGPSALTVAFMYENLVAEISNSSVGGKVVAIYPKEGSLYADHPFMILNGNWITPAQRTVAQAFLNFLNEPSTVKSAMEYGFRPINSSITLDPNEFNYQNNGIAYNLTNPELKTPTGQTLLNIPDFWKLCKAGT